MHESCIFSLTPSRSDLNTFPMLPTKRTRIPSVQMSKRARFSPVIGRFQYIDEATDIGVRLLPAAVRVWSEGLEATRVVGVDGDNLLLEAPDWSTRIKCAENIADRFGLPKRSEVSGRDGAPLQAFTDEQIDDRLRELLRTHRKTMKPLVEVTLVPDDE